MQIDRKRFFLLTSMLTAAACGSKTDPSPNAPSGPISIPVQPPAPASTTPAATTTAETATPDAGRTKETPVASSEDDDEQPYQDWPGTANPPLAKTVHAQSCDVSENAKGKAVACALKAPPGPTCESFGETKADCPKLSRWLVPRVAEKAAACLNTKSGKKDICLFNVGPSCVIESLSSACLNTDAKIETSCKRVMAKCNQMDKQYRHMTTDACKAALSAIVPARHSSFVSCAQESCDLVPCMYAAQR